MKRLQTFALRVVRRVVTLAGGGMMLEGDGAVGWAGLVLVLGELAAREYIEAREARRARARRAETGDGAQKPQFLEPLEVRRARAERQTAVLGNGVQKRCQFGFAPNAMLDHETQCMLPSGHDGEHRLVGGDV